MAILMVEPPTSSGRPKKPARPKGPRPYSRPRGGEAKAISDLMPEVGRAAFRRFGFVQSSVVTRWPEIVGDRYAEVSAPQAIRFPSGQRSGGTLELTVSGAHATLMQHVAGDIVLQPSACRAPPGAQTRAGAHGSDGGQGEGTDEASRHELEGRRAALIRRREEAKAEAQAMRAALDALKQLDPSALRNGELPQDVVASYLANASDALGLNSRATAPTTAAAPAKATAPATAAATTKATAPATAANVQTGAIGGGARRASGGRVLPEQRGRADRRGARKAPAAAEPFSGSTRRGPRGRGARTDIERSSRSAAAAAAVAADADEAESATHDELRSR